MENAKMSPGKGLLILLAVIVVIGIYIAITAALGLTDFWAGFLFLLYWSMVEGAKPERLVPSIVGAFVGMGTAAMMVLLPPLLGEGTGMAVFGVTVLVLVYAVIMGWAPVAVNASTMLFLTVGTVPHIEGNADYGQIFLGIISGIVFFGGLALIATAFARKKATTA